MGSGNLHQVHLLLYRHAQGEHWIVGPNRYDFLFGFVIPAKSQTIEVYLLSCVGALMLVSETDHVPCKGVSKQ
jgi:hypothetical protein